MDTEHTCPRCHHKIPNDATPGAYPGAMSRFSRDVEVCSACGTHEALQQVAGIELAGPSDWPIEVPEDLYLVNDPVRLESIKAQLGVSE